MFERFAEQPIFVLTSDQDWAPAWACEQFLSLIESRNLPAHFFRTNPCPVIDAAVASGRITQGWHPNFLPGSTHGADIDSIIDYMRLNFPGATTARMHAFFENTFCLRALVNAGIVADSQLATLYQPGLVPILQFSGLLRFPIFFEDDIFFDYDSNEPFQGSSGALDLNYVKEKLFTPGLKLLNFHAIFVAANIPSRPVYAELKSRLFAENSQPYRWEGRGTLQVFEELVDTVIDAGFTFLPFPDLVESVLELIAENPERFPKPFGTAGSHSRPLTV